MKFNLHALQVRIVLCIAAMLTLPDALCQTQYVLQQPNYPNGGVWSETELYSPYLYYSGNDTYQNGADIGSSGGAGWSGKCNGQQTWQWNWTGTDSAPKNVIIKVTSSASWSAQKTDGSGSCEDGYQDPSTPVGTPKTIGGISSGTHYLIYNNPGSTFSLQLTPTASSYDGPCMVSVIMSPTDVALQVFGGIGPDDHDSCLIGQYCFGILSAGPYLIASKGTNWSFAFTGTDYLQQSPNWDGPQPSLGVTSKPGCHLWIPITQPMPSANNTSPFWFAPVAGSETITANANAYDPSGHMIGPITGQYVMTSVALSKTTLTLTPGVASSTQLYLVSGQNRDTAPGMYMDYSAVVPDAFFDVQGSGYLMMGQLVNYNQQAVPGIGLLTSNGWALDNTFQYSNFESSPVPSINSFDGDTPDQSHSPVGWASVNDQYQSFSVYFPPSNGIGSEYIPLVEQDWIWKTSDTYPPYHAVASPIPGLQSADPFQYFWWLQVYTNPTK